MERTFLREGDIMAWDATKVKRVLFLQRTLKNGKKAFVIYPFSQITTPLGDQYMEPLPMHELAGGYGDMPFDKIEFIDPPGHQSAGFLKVTRVDPNMAVRRTGG